jgi:hypothetical protein
LKKAGFQMKKLFLIGLIFLSVPVGAQIKSSVICDHRLKASSPLFQNALDNIYSFAYIHHALERIKNEAGTKEVLFCTSSIALSKNIYQYFKYLIQIDVYLQGSNVAAYKFRFLFQNASIQAFHNVGGQPWAGLDTSRTDQTLREFTNLAEYHPFIGTTSGLTNPIEIARKSQSFQRDGQNIDLSTLSAIPIPGNQDKQFYLVTWLTKSPENPYAGQVLTRGVLISIGPDQSIGIAENNFPGGDLLIPLEVHLEELVSQVGPSTHWVEKLLKIAAQNQIF